MYFHFRGERGFKVFSRTFNFAQLLDFCLKYWCVYLLSFMNLFQESKHQVSKANEALHLAWDKFAALPNQKNQQEVCWCCFSFSHFLLLVNLDLQGAIFHKTQFVLCFFFLQPAALDRAAHVMLSARENYQVKLAKYIQVMREIHTVKKVTQKSNLPSANDQ